MKLPNLHTLIVRAYWLGHSDAAREALYESAGAASLAPTFGQALETLDEDVMSFAESDDPCGWLNVRYSGIEVKDLTDKTLDGREPAELPATNAFLAVSE